MATPDLSAYYEDFDKGLKDEKEATKLLCYHKPGDCTWNLCPRCKKISLHRWVRLNGFKIEEYEECKLCKLQNSRYIR